MQSPDKTTSTSFEGMSITSKSNETMNLYSFSELKKDKSSELDTFEEEENVNEKDLVTMVKKIQQRGNISELKTKNTMQKVPQMLAQNTEKKLMDTVSEMKRQREEEMMKEMKALKTAKNLESSDTLVEEYKNNTEMSKDSKNSNDEGMIQELHVKRRNSIPEILAQNDEKKLMDTVSKMRRQREEELKEMKVRKSADSSGIFKKDKKNSKEIYKSKEIRDVKKEESSELKTKNTMQKVPEILAQNNEKKLMDTVSEMKRRREEEMMKEMNALKTSDVETCDMLPEENKSSTEKSENSKILNDAGLSPKSQINRGTSISQILAQNDEKKLMDTVSKMKQQREKEIKEMKALKTTTIVGAVEKENKKDEQSSNSKNSSRKIAQDHQVKRKSSVEKLPDVLAKASKEKTLDTVSKLKMQREKEMKEVKAQKLTDKACVSKPITKGKEKKRSGDVNVSIKTVLNSKDNTEKKNILPSSLREEAKEKELANTISQMRERRSSEIDTLRMKKSTRALQEEIFGKKDSFENISSQKRVSEIQTTSVSSIRDAMIIPLVNYKNNDYRAFIFVIHKQRGLMLLRCANKLKKGNYFSKVPGGRIIEDEFMAAARISLGDVQKELVNASKLAASRLLYDETGMDVRKSLGKLLPVDLRDDDEEVLDSDFPCELKKRVFFHITVDDENFYSKEDINNNLNEFVSSDSTNAQDGLMLKISDNVAGFSFEKDLEKAVELIIEHSGGVCSNALSMALERNLPPFCNQLENVEELMLPKVPKKKGFFSCFC